MDCEYLGCKSPVAEAERGNSMLVRRFCAKHRHLCNQAIAMLYNGSIDEFVQFWMSGLRFPVKSSELAHRDHGITVWLLLKPLLLKIRMDIIRGQGRA
jgi:hypothetical protein